MKLHTIVTVILKISLFYPGMMDALDQSIGKIFEYLSDADMLENTIFAYSSDNGGAPYGPHGSRGFNWPLRGSKITLWEGGVRAAAFLWSPLLKSSPRASNQMMHVVDWMITLYSAAGQSANISSLEFKRRITFLMTFL